MSFAEHPLPEGRSLVLGAGGFLGCHIARWLTSQGAPVRLFDLAVDTLPKTVTQAPGCEVIQANLLDETDLKRALEDVNQVFHFVSATVPSTSIHQVDGEIHANVIPTVRLLDAMRELGVPTIVFPSSGGTLYGTGSAAELSREGDPLDPTCSYGLGKLLIEDILRFHASHGGPDYLTLRISNPYGPSAKSHRRQGVINAFLEQVRRDEPIRIWGNGSAIRDFIFIDDLIGAVSAALRSSARNETFNLGSGEGHSVKEVVECVAAVTGRDVRIEHEPGEYAGVPYNVIDATRLTERTGWRPTVSLPDGIRQTWQKLVDPESP